MGPVSADRAALTGKASRGNLTQPPSAAFHVVSAQSLLSLSYALYDPAAQKKRWGREEKKKKRKSCKSRPGVARMNTTAEFLRQRRSDEQLVYYTSQQQETQEPERVEEAGMWVSGCVWQEIYFVLTVAYSMCAPPNVHSKTDPWSQGGEVMCATCAIMSSTEFGHGLVKAEPGYPFAVLSQHNALLQTQVRELKGPEWLNEQRWSTCFWTELKIERSLFVQTAHTHRQSEGQGMLLSFIQKWKAGCL